MKQSGNTCTTVIRTETAMEHGRTYRYSLFFCEGTHRTRLYSVRAELTGESGAHESAEVTDAFSDPAHALIFFSLCREHLVTPVHLEEILMDFEY